MGLVIFVYISILGVGGFVVNDKNEILVVKEKNGPATNVWKMPGVAFGSSMNVITRGHC